MQAFIREVGPIKDGTQIFNFNALRTRLVVFPLQFISFAAALRSTPWDTSTVAAWVS